MLKRRDFLSFLLGSSEPLLLNPPNIQQLPAILLSPPTSGPFKLISFPLLHSNFYCFGFLLACLLNSLIDWLILRFYFVFFLNLSNHAWSPPSPAGTTPPTLLQAAFHTTSLDLLCTASPQCCCQTRPELDVLGHCTWVLRVLQNQTEERTC